MSVNTNASNKAIVEDYFKAMRAGPAGAEQIVALFAEDGVYIEPFSGGGRHTPHQGKQQIRRFFEEARRNQPPDMQVEVKRIDVDGEVVTSEWICTSAAFPVPMQGHDTYVIHDGKIARLEISLEAPPQA